MIYVTRESGHVSDPVSGRISANATDHASEHVTEHAEAIRAAVACMNKELSEAVITAIEAENPVDGYREAVEMIEDTFEDMDAAMIEDVFKSSVLRILRARVDGLMREAKRRSGSKENVL